MKHREKSPESSKVYMTEVVLPQHTNPLGTIFGGVVLSWVDIAASICAQKHCEKLAVTASIDAMHFLAPIQLGWIVYIKAKINYAWKTSCEIEIHISAEDPLKQQTYHTASAFVTMVAIGDDHKPSLIPKVKASTDLEKKCFYEAQERKKMRLKLKQKLLS